MFFKNLEGRNLKIKRIWHTLVKAVNFSPEKTCLTCDNFILFISSPKSIVFLASVQEVSTAAKKYSGVQEQKGEYSLSAKI